MTTFDTWQSALFSGGMQGIYLFLLVASALTALLTRKGRRKSLAPRVYAWWLMLPVIHLALLFQVSGLIVFTALIALLAFRDLFRLSLRPRTFCAVAAGFAAISVLIVFSGEALSPLMQSVLLLALPSVLTGSFRREHRQVQNLYLWLAWASACCGLGFFGLLIGMIAQAPEQHMRWMFFLLVMTCFNDVAQFISGSRFGKQKIAASISPNKTLQGVVGGVTVSTLLAMAFGTYLQLAPVPVLAALGAVLSVCGLAGDLWFSAIKRRLQIKDFSDLIPGHGGILDRADSLMLTAPAMTFFLMIWQTR